MRKPLRLVVIATVLVAAAAFPALAQNPHLKGRNPVMFIDNILALTATVSYAGLGNFDTLQNAQRLRSPRPTASTRPGEPATRPEPRGGQRDGVNRGARG